MVKEEDKKLMDVVNKLVSDKNRDIPDFDTGLRYKLFNPISESPKKAYQEIRDNLWKVFSRLKKQYSDQGKQEAEIIEKIADFLKNTKLPYCIPTIDDYKQREGRFFILSREDNDIKASCLADNLKTVYDEIREEQYFSLCNKGILLLADAVAELDEDVLQWNRKNFVLYVPSVGEVKIE